MWTTSFKVALVLLLLSSLHNTGPGFVSGQDLSCHDMVARMEFGRTVVRGRDWKHGNHEGTPGSQGTVIGMAEYGWYNVQWSNGKTEKYQMVYDNKCDLMIIEPNGVYQHSSTLTCQEMIPMTKVGATVQRGKDWKWGDQDGTPPKQGKIVGTAEEGWFLVKWGSNTFPNKYRMLYREICELKPVRLFSETQDPQPRQCSSVQVTSNAQTPVDSETAKTSKEAANLAKEANTLLAEAAKLTLQTAQASAKVEEDKKKEAENLVEASRITLQAAKDKAKAEDDERQIVMKREKLALASAEANAKLEDTKTKEAENLLEGSRITLQAAKDKAKAEENEHQIAVKRETLALAAAKKKAADEDAVHEIALKRANLALEATKTNAKAEEIWQLNAQEELDFERKRRSEVTNAFNSNYR